MVIVEAGFRKSQILSDMSPDADKKMSAFAGFLCNSCSQLRGCA